MEGTFVSPPAKRPISAASNGSHKRSKKSKRSNRSRPTPPPLTVPAGHVAFRLLCHESLVGGFIGKSGAVIKQLQLDTDSKIRVEEAPPSCDDRAIVVIASSALKNTIALGSSKNDGDTAAETEVSAAQEALVRVFERVLNVAAETEGGGASKTPPPGGVVACRLLADSSQVGSVIGKGGMIIESIRTETGCKIRVSKGEKLPGCAGISDELVEIEGDILAVKKALVAISRRLQDFPPADKTKMIGCKSLEAIPQETSKQSSLLLPKPNSSMAFTSGVRPLSLETNRVSMLDSEALQQDVVFKILCSTDRVGGVIGKGGSIVRALQSETGASISIGPLVAECDERLITITASENLESRYSSAQNALCLVFARSVEAGFENGLDSGLNNGTMVSARLVAPSNQVGCLLGRGGAIISEMRSATGAGIRIIRSDQVPKCASENEVVQISGEFLNVQDAICHVTSRLRDNVFSSTTAPSGAGSWCCSSVQTEVSPYGRARDVGSLGVCTSFVSSHSLNPQTSLIGSLDNIGPHNLDHPSPRLLTSRMVAGVYPRGVTDTGRGFTSLKGGLELGSGSKSAIVAHTTMEIVVPENVIGSVYGENGGNLTRLRQISGAKVIVHEPHSGTSDRIVVISGTPDETQAAQSLLQAFILTGQS